MVFKYFCIIVLWAKVASALEGLRPCDGYNGSLILVPVAPLIAARRPASQGLICDGRVSITVQTFNSCTSRPDVCQCLVVETLVDNMSNI